MKIEVPDGDVVDRITILEIKVARLVGSGREHAETERAVLCAAWDEHQSTPLEAIPQTEALRRVNTALWDVEARLRELEAAGDFGDEFVQEARSVYRLNDERARLKRAISQQTGSRLIEQKSYT